MATPLNVGSSSHFPSVHLISAILPAAGISAIDPPLPHAISLASQELRQPKDRRDALDRFARLRVFQLLFRLCYFAMVLAAGELVGLVSDGRGYLMGGCGLP